jgi:NADH-quinone oxidoreductase subunit J
MLLDVEEREKLSFRSATALVGVIGLALLSGLIVYLFNPGAPANESALASPAFSTFTPPALPPGDAPHVFTTSAKSFGLLLFTKYLLPLQVTGFLLLIAMIGVIQLSKKLNKVPEAPVTSTARQPRKNSAPPASTAPEPSPETVAAPKEHALPPGGDRSSSLAEKS